MRVIFEILQDGSLEQGIQADNDADSVRGHQLLTWISPQLRCVAASARLFFLQPKGEVGNDVEVAKY